MKNEAYPSSIFRQLIDGAPDAMVIVDQRGVIEFVNMPAERLFGYTREELLGQQIEMLVPERFRDAHIRDRNAFMSAPKNRPMGANLELFGRRRDGSEVPIEISLSPLDTPAGMLISSSIRDVSARRRAEQKFRLLLEAAPDAMVIVDLEGRIVFVNAQTERLFGYPRAELIGGTVEMLVPKRFRSQHLLHRGGYAREPKPRSMGSGLELFGVRKDNSEFPIEISLSPLETDEGMLISSAIRDITERRQTEATARLASDRLLSAIESIQGGLALYDAEDRLVLCNSAYRALFGTGFNGPIIGRIYAEIIDTSLSSGLIALGDEAGDAFRSRRLAYRQDPVGILESRTRDGRTLRTTDRRTLEGGTVTTVWDVTDDVEHEAELTKARKLAEAASTAKSEFLSSMSHELRTPLNSILGFAQLLQIDRKTPLNAGQKEKLDYVLKGGEHLLHLIDDILDLSHIEAGRVVVSPEPVGLAEVLAEVKTALDPMASRAGVAVSISPLPDGTPPVIADRTRFAQILINFGSNAIKYSRPGGSAVLHVWKPRPGLVRVSMRDDGIGIPLDKQDKIFQPFQRAGQETGPIQGTGIGLAITKRLAELMGGSVGFSSVPDAGSEFWLDLAAHDTQSAPVEAGKRPLASESALHGSEGAHYTIVYIEDNPSNIAFMEGLITELERVTLISIPTAEVGIEVVRTKQPDVVIMDINLPGMSGFEATRKLGEWPETKDIPVIALTAAAMTGDRKRAEEARFYRYLTKPVKVAELLGTLEELLAKDRAGNRSIS